MGALMKLVLGAWGGPLGWLATAASWIKAGLAWCVEHPKIVCSVVALLFAAYVGANWDHARMNKKVIALQNEVAEMKRTEKAIADDHQRQVEDFQGAIAAINAQEAKDKAARDVAYKKLQEELKNYAKNHSGEVPSGDVCRAVDIGDDGLRLIRDAISARFLRGGAGEGVGFITVPEPAGPAKQQGGRDVAVGR